MLPRTKLIKWGATALAMFLCAIVILIAFTITLLMWVDWNHAKPWINRQVSHALEREFAIRGNLSVEWKHAPSSMTGWRGWIPWPTIDAQNITVANPSWIETTSSMVKVNEVMLSIAPLPLLHHLIVIPELNVDAPHIYLQRASENQNNWTFKQSDKPSRWNFELNNLFINKGTVRFVDNIRKADVRANIDTLTSPSSSEETRESDYGLTWNLSGDVNGDAVSGEGRAGKILSLQEEHTRYPIEAVAKIGKTTIRVNGTLTNPRNLAALDLNLKLSGVSLDQLYQVSGIFLPNTPPYSTEGHLTGTLNRHGGNWRYEQFKGRVGASDIAGTLEFIGREPRPLIKGEVVSNVLNFDDLAPIIGADSNARKIQRGQEPVQPKDKVLPVETFKTERWKSIDADVHFSGKRIVRKKELPIDNLVTHVQLQNGVLTLAPLNFGVAGGKLTSNIKLDSNKSKELQAEMKMSARHFKLKQLLPTLPEMHTSLGEINGDAALTATGNSVSELLGSANGEIKALIDHGTISKLLLEEMGLNIGNVIATKLFGDKQVNLNCLASDFKVTDGVATARTFVMDTDEASLYINGKLDLENEKIDLTLNPDTKSMRVVTLRSPIYVNGTFKKPSVDLDKGTLAAKAGAAVALGIAAPVAAALLPLVSLGEAKNNPCGTLLAQASKKPKAPAPEYSTGK